MPEARYIIEVYRTITHEDLVWLFHPSPRSKLYTAKKNVPDQADQSKTRIEYEKTNEPITTEYSCDKSRHLNSHSPIGQRESAGGTPSCELETFTSTLRESDPNWSRVIPNLQPRVDPDAARAGLPKLVSMMKATSIELILFSGVRSRTRGRFPHVFAGLQR